LAACQPAHWKRYFVHQGNNLPHVRMTDLQVLPSYERHRHLGIRACTRNISFRHNESSGSERLPPTGLCRWAVNRSTVAYFSRYFGCLPINRDEHAGSGKAMMAVPRSTRIKRRMRSTAGLRFWLCGNTSCRPPYLNRTCNRGLTTCRGGFHQITWTYYLVGMAVQFSNRRYNHVLVSTPY
jgi:hypothetical protein